MLFAGIDAGQSSTTAVVLDEDGMVRGRGKAGPADHVDEPPDSTRAADACRQAVGAALTAAEQPADAPLEAVVIGLSGFAGRWHGVEPAFRTERVRYEHDAPVALAGATDERPAAVIIAGTGSACYGESFSGRIVVLGGYGFLFGDEGSSFAIARNAIAGAMRAADAGHEADLGAAALAYFDLPDLRALARAVSLHEISRPRLASFARVVHDAARLGDAAARGIVDDAAGALVALAVRAVELLEGSEATPVPVAFVGGGFANAEFRATTERRFGEATPNGRAVPPRHEPAVGAALLAFDLAGRPRPATAAPGA
jgi:N-acetylglucosamine kinase-like BadF-type ATPase